MLRFKLLIALLSFLIVPAVLYCQETTCNKIIYNHTKYNLYPETFSELPDIPSPMTTNNGMEIVICFTHDNRYCLIPVTHENGNPLDYKNNQWYGKGRQLDIDSTDFPTLARTGLHSEKELNKTKTITGKSISEITQIGRPEACSRAGFISNDEDIISVLKGDNKLVNMLGSTHRQIVKPLFHVFNVILTVKKDSERGNVKGIIYNNKNIYLKFWGSKGWQESIFNDEVLGQYHLEMWRELDQSEKEYLLRNYSNLSDEDMSELIKKLTYIHTGEMVPYYIMRYGFYEGHTDFRADPIAIAFIFGLRSIQEIEKAFKGDMYKTLTNHFTQKHISK